MFKYETSLKNSPPVRQSPLAGLGSAFDYAGPHGDVFRAKMAENNANLNVTADSANAAYDLDRQRAENAIVSQGLQMLSQDRRNKMDYDTGRLQSMYGISNQLLRGLFG